MGLENNALILDLHPNNQVITDYSLVKKYVSGIVWKCSESDTMRFDISDEVQEGYDNDIPVLCYHWHNPNLYTGFPLNDKNRWKNPDPQIANIEAAVKNKKYYGLALDIEQYWQVYSEWYEYLRGARSQEDVKKVTATWISESARHVASLMFNKWGKLGKPILGYTAKWFVETYAPGIQEWLQPPTFNAWMASYWWGIKKTLSWDELLEKYIPPAVVTKDGKDKSTFPWLGNSKARMWQFSGDQFTLQGIVSKTTGKPCAVDLNLFDGTKEDFYNFIGFTPKQTEPVEEPEPEEPPADPGDDPTDISDSKIDAIYDLLLEIKEHMLTDEELADRWDKVFK